MKTKYLFLVTLSVALIFLHSFAEAQLSSPTLTATAVSSSQIDLNWIDPNNKESGVEIQRLNPSSGQFQTIATVVKQETSYSDTGLNAGTQYSYRLMPFFKSEYVYSNIANATTLGGSTPTIPSAPSSLSATAVSSSQINLSWADNSSNEDGFKIERSTSATNGFIQIATVGANVTTYQNTGLTASTTYYYRVRAYNTAGNSGYSNTSSATTQGTTVTVPNAPTNLTATAISSSQINLGWTDNSNNEEGFHIWRYHSSVGWSQIAVVSANTTSYPDTGLSASTTYMYSVRAYNSLGVSGWSNTTSATTLSGSVTLPSAPSSLSATAVSSSQINLSWADNSSNETGFKIDRATSSSGPWSQIATVGANTTSYQNAGLNASTTYYYHVHAYNTAGDSAACNTASATTQSGTADPDAPSNLTANAVSSSQINLNWIDNSSNENGFEIERALSSGGPWSKIATLGANVTSYSNTGLSSSTTYYYRVRAYTQTKIRGKWVTEYTAYSNIDGATTQGASDTTPPPAPIGLSATPNTWTNSNSFSINWTNPSDPSGIAGAYYKLGAAPTSNTNGTYTTSKPFAVSATSQGGQTIYIWLKDGSGNTSYLNRSSTTLYYDGTAPTDGILSANAGNALVSLSWSGFSDSGGSGLRSTNTYKVMRNTGTYPASQCTSGTQVYLGSGSPITDTGLTNGTTYYYRACAYDNAGNVSTGATASATPTATDTTPPSVPTGLTATTISSSQINLNWSPSYDTGGSGLAGYKVYRSVTQIGTTTATNYSDNGLTANTQYCYQVAAYDNAGNNSAKCTQVCATTQGSVSSGAYLWAHKAEAISSSYSAIAFDVAVDAGGNATSVGYFTGSIDFGCGMLSSTSTSDIFVVRYSPTGSCLWSKKLGSSSGSPSTAYSVAVDGSSNIVVTGWFSGSLDFGGGSIPSAGVDDIFIAKYSSTGTYLWAKRLGGLSNEHAYSITTDNNSNIIVTGYFAGTVDFGGGSLTSAGGADIFIAKYSPTGNYLWAKRMGGSGSDIGWSVATDSSSDIVVTGHFSGSVNFGGSTLTSAGGKDIFVAKYYADGTYVWSKRFGNSTDDYVYGVAMDNNDNVVLTGTFHGTVDFGGGPLTPAGGGDIFLAKYSPSGQYIWAKQFGTTSSFASIAYAVSVDENDNIVLTGSILGNINFGSGWLFSNGSYDIFLAKFSPDGVNLWSKRFGTAYDDRGRAVAVDTYGNVFMVGDFFESVDFGGGTLTSAYTPDAFIAKFTP